jgi:hypothetical protein
MAKRKSTSPTAKAPKTVLEFNVLDAATKARITDCIERRGKVTVTMTHVGKPGAKTAEFAQQID